MTAEHPEIAGCTEFTHSERLRGAALGGPLVGIGIALVVTTLILIGTQPTTAWAAWLAWALCLLPLCAIISVIMLGRVAVSVCGQSVRFRAPFFSRCMVRSEITDVSVVSDNGLTEGNMSWFVTRQDMGACTRLSMGGAASVTVTGGDGRKIQLVVRDLPIAQTIARTIRTTS